MRPISFGRQRPMSGLLYEPARGTVRGEIVLANPFGQEAVRSSVMYRLLALRLAAQGFWVLRFDYHGTGDSPGEGEDQTLADWCGDLLVAHEYLADVSHARRACSFGVGLGGTIAAMAACNSTRPADELYLWDPVFDGPAYIARIKRAHVAELERAFGLPWKAVAKLTGESAPRVPGYVLGFPIGDELAREIDAIGPDLPRRAAQSNARCHVALAPDALAMCSSAQLPNLIGQAISRPINFMTNEARGMPLVPPEVLAFVQKVWSGV